MEIEQKGRWAFEPEIGYSQRWGHWVTKAYKVFGERREGVIKVAIKP